MQYIALLALTVALQTTSQARTPEQVATNRAAFAASTRTTKVATLNQLAAHRLSLPTDDVVDIVLAGMTDEDDGVRVTALGAAGGQLAAARFSPDAISAARVERPIVQKLRSPLLSALNDRVPKARQLATIALVNLEYESGSRTQEAGSRTGAIKLSDEVAQALVNQYVVDQSALVRIEIAKTFALTEGPAVLRESVLERALDDPDATVVSYVAMGLGKSKSANALKRIVQLLRHSERNVRLQAAQALVAYGASARPYLPQLEEAATIEQDPVVLKTLRGAIAAIQ